MGGSCSCMGHSKLWVLLIKSGPYWWVGFRKMGTTNRLFTLFSVILNVYLLVTGSSWYTHSIHWPLTLLVTGSCWYTHSIHWSLTLQEIIYNIDPLTVGSRASKRNARRQSRGYLPRRKRPQQKPFSFRQLFQNSAATSSPPRNTYAADSLEPRFAEETAFTTSTFPPSSTTTAPTASLFNLDQLAVIRSGNWKLITGPVGFDEIIPNPDTDIFECKYFTFQMKLNNLFCSFKM